MKKVATIREAQENFDEFVAAAKRGEKRLFGRYGKPEARLVALSPNEIKKLNTKTNDK